MILRDTLSAFLVKAKNAGCQRLVVAYSGGIDSHVLLHQLHQINQLDEPIALDAIYINHNLNKDSDRWGQHCEKVCDSLKIPFLQINVDAKPEAGESPEEKARTVRYQALQQQLDNEHWLVTAQHREDQAETLILQLLRGSGVNGLSAMPMVRKLGKGKHFRPLLKIDKQLIEEYAAEHQLGWIEDPSNMDLDVARNYVRKTVLPSIKNVWPETTNMLEKSATWLAEAAELIDQVAEQDLLLIQADNQSLKIPQLKQLTYIRQKNLLRYWFFKMGLKRPGNDKLEIIFEQIIDAREDAKPLLEWQGISVRRHQQHLYLLPQWPIVDDDWQTSWDGQVAIKLPDDWAELSCEEVTGHGLSERYITQQMTLSIRKGGEICHPADRSKKRSLKKLFQEYSIPPWLRDRWPLLYCDQQLVAVPGLFICKGFEAEETEKGFVFSVNPDPSWSK